jgi:hypothetical protein
MASLRRQLAPRIQELLEHPSRSECEPIAEQIVVACRTRQNPKKALAVTLRHLKGDLSTHALELIAGLVQEQLGTDRRPRVAAPVRPTGTWLTLQGAAATLDLHPNTLAERLRAVRYRRLYGWPVWDGHQWRIATDAVDPATAATYLATAPSDEPLAIELMLPEWCERSPRPPADTSRGTPVPLSTMSG